MSLNSVMSAAKQKALDAMLGDRIEREEAKALADWQAKVRALKQFEADQAKELTSLEVDEAAALRDVEALRPRWNALNNRYGFSRRKHAERRSDLSWGHHRLHNDAENAAPSMFRDLIIEIVATEKQLQSRPTNERKVYTGRTNHRGYPEYSLESDYPAIAERLQTLRHLREQVQQMRTEVIDDPAAVLAKIREQAVAAAKM